MRKLYLAFCFLLLQVTLASADQIDSLNWKLRVDTTRSYPVCLDGDTLFLIRAGVPGLSAQARATVISGRIAAFADEIMPLDSVRLEDAGIFTEVLASERYLLAVWDIDGTAAGTTREMLARDIAAKIRASVEAYRKEYSARSLLQGIGLSLLATIALVILWKIILRLHRTALARLQPRVRGIRVQQKEVVRADWIRGLITLVASGVRAFLVIILLYAYADFVLSVFAWTRPFAASIFRLVMVPVWLMWDSFVQEIPNLAFIAVLAIVTRYLLLGIRLLFREVETGRLELPGFYADWAHPTYKIVRILVIAFAAVVAFPYIPGSSSPAFQGVSIFLGVLLSLGSSSAVSNIVAGVILTYMRSFKAGDVVRIGDATGVVLGSTLLVTRIRTWKNVEVTVPNSVVLGAHVTNYSIQAHEKNLILPTSVTIGYDAPWRQVHGLLLMAAKKTPNLLTDPAPFVLQNSLNDFYVTYELNVYTEKATAMIQIYSDLHRNIQDAFNEHGVQIMSPHYVADRGKPTVVPKDKWYAPPARKPGETGADV
jgi:small-conductance mechanosensitive channel